MPFNTGLSGLKAASSSLRITGNNIANASTTGFKESRAEFADVYAASVLGTGGNAIGTGVRVSRVSQQFTNGTVNFTNNNMDLAINGQGFFSLDAGGERLYTRAGSFSIDREGYIVNSDSAKLRGYLPDYSTDPQGVISGAVGNIQLDVNNIPPEPTTKITASLNLPAVDDGEEKSPFVTGFTPESPPQGNTFDVSTEKTIYDSLGQEHLLKMYFIKDDSVNNQWQMFVGINGTDVTPAPTNNIPNPFTVKFDENGGYVLNNPTNPPNIDSSATVTSNENNTNKQLVDVSGLSALQSGDLVINGVTVAATTADGISTTNADASAAAIKNAIDLASVPGLSTTIVPAQVDLGKFINGSVNLAAGDFVINGTDITGNFADQAALIAGINAQTGTTGVTASEVDGNITLSGPANGGNISLTTDGVVDTNNPGFENFNFTSGATTKVMRGDVKLEQSGPNAIKIAGTSPTSASFVPGTFFATVTQSNSDLINISDFDPKNGAALQDISIDLGESTQHGDSYSLKSLIDDGSPVGLLSSLSTDSSGVLFASFTNGKSRKLGQIILANFSNTQGLQPQGNTAWSETFSSGTALEGVPETSNLGSIQEAALEDSNVQLTEELVDLIIAQRNFQANAQTIRTADTVTQTIINIR